MTRRRPGRSLRARLVLWSVATLTALLVVYTAAVVLFLRESLRGEFRHQLHDHLTFEAQLLTRTATGVAIGTGRRGADEAGPSRLWVRVRNLDGAILDAQPRSEPGADVRWTSGRYTIGGLPVVLEVGKSDAPMQDRLRQLLIMMGLGLPVALVGAGVAGFVLAGRALAPVGRMAARAQSITAERLRERLPVENPGDEIGTLAAVFNQTLARLERSFEALRRFTADASHELRTPLTAMRSVGEVGLHEERDAIAYREVIGSMLEEVDRLSRLVDSLLTLSRGDAGHVPLHQEAVDLTALAREIVRHLGVLAEEKQQLLAVEAAGPVYAWADRLMLRQALINLVDNAVKYTPEEGGVVVRVRDGGGQPTIEVVDDGPGIAAEHVEHIFDRFYRIDKARSRDRGGVGLGLAIARWAVEASGGRIELEATVPHGCRFRLTLPAVSIAGASKKVGLASDAPAEANA